MRRTLLALLGLVVATPALGLTLTEPAKDPRGRALTAANPVYACFLGVGEAGGGEWIKPSGPAGGKCRDVTDHRPSATPDGPVRVWSACIFRGPLGGAVWGPIESRWLTVTETLGPAPLPLP